MTVDELTENFELLGDWEERYRYLIELGEALPPMDEAAKTDENKVRGCMSQVWMTVKSRPDGSFDFDADSDAHIVRGLIAVLRIVYAGRSYDEIADIDIEEIFKRLKLESHLSPNRRNGFFAMVGRIQGLAQQDRA